MQFVGGDCAAAKVVVVAPSAGKTTRAVAKTFSAAAEVVRIIMRRVAIADRRKILERI